MRLGNTTPNGGVYISMGHLGADNVRRMFKGMVERCADCGFDLAGGLVEVVPTAHYMMGGVVFDTDCTTELPGLFAAGEDTGGVHGANRLGGNGVANSTVYGGLAGDHMPRWLARHGGFAEPAAATIEAAIERARHPLQRKPGNVEEIRQRLFDVMWDDVGIVRNETGLRRAAARLDELEAQLDATGVPHGTLAFNLTWHDWLNLKNLLLVSKAIRAAAQAREDSRGAHFRADFPSAGELTSSAYTCVRAADGGFDIATRPVEFTRVQPGESLIGDQAAA
jgi:fumarate reductase flavoprotein subunit